MLSEIYDYEERLENLAKRLETLEENFRSLLAAEGGSAHRLPASPS